MTVRISYDEGTRPGLFARLIEKGPGGYLTMTVLPQGSVGGWCMRPELSAPFPSFGSSWIGYSKDGREAKLIALHIDGSG